MPQEQEKTKKLAVLLVVLLVVSVVVGVFAIHMAVTTRQTQPTPTPKETATVVSPTLETTAAEFLGKGTVKSVDRSDPVLRDAGLEKISVQIILGPKTRTNNPDWKILAPVAEVFQEGESVNLVSITHTEHYASPNRLFHVLIRQPPPEMAKPTK